LKRGRSGAAVLCLYFSPNLGPLKNATAIKFEYGTLGGASFIPKYTVVFPIMLFSQAAMIQAEDKRVMRLSVVLKP
jgi:hypothetical protein